MSESTDQEQGEFARCARLLLQEIKDSGPADDGRAELFSMSKETLTAGTIVLLREILDHLNEYELTNGVGSFFEACENSRSRCARIRQRNAKRVSGFLGLICINVRLLERRLGVPDPREQERADSYCRERLLETPVKAAVYAVYDPLPPPLPSRSNTTEEQEGRKPADSAIKLWRKLDPDKFEYYKAGTTSFILKCRKREPEDQSGHYEDLVLKCVLFPWNTVTPIARSTADYASLYGEGKTTEVVVHPRASTANWVVMPFQEGDTLYEYLRQFEQSNPKRHDRVREARRVGVALIHALDRLADLGPVDPALPGRQHLDLAPGNVIIEPRHPESQELKLKFIDLGRNHLYSRQVGIAEHDDSVYVAPEVKNRNRSEKSDIYSLGIMLAQILTGYAPRDGRVPDGVYQMSPTLARALEDLLDEDHHKRLILLREQGAFRYRWLKTFFDEAFELVELEPALSSSRFERWYARWGPGSRELMSLLRKWHHQPRRSHSGYLLTFLLVAAVAWWAIFTRTSVINVSDVLVGKAEPLPSGVTLAANVIAFNIGLISWKFYSMVLARLTVAAVPGIMARVTEIGMRGVTVIALPTAVLAAVWKPELWAWTIGVAALGLTVTNLLMLLMARRLLEVGGRNFTTVPESHADFPGGFSQWWWTMFLYAVVIIVIAAGLEVGWMRDLPAYVIGLVMVNLGVHYVSKCVMAGESVRGGLARAFTTGERLARLWQRGGDIDGWPTPKPPLPSRGSTGAPKSTTPEAAS